MIWEDHSRDIPKGKHALFGGSQYSWSNISMENDEEFEDVLRSRYYATFAKDIGTIMHAWAADRIKYRANVIKSDSKSLFIYIMNAFEAAHNYIPRQVVSYYIETCFPNLMLYIKDAIGFRLDPEVNLKYAEDFYGTADAIL